jgi:hypothetical protein
MTKRHHVQMQHLHGKYFCAGRNGSLLEVVAALLRDGHPSDTTFEIVDAPSGRVMLHAHEPLSAMRHPGGAKHSLSEAFGRKRGGG